MSTLPPRQPLIREVMGQMLRELRKSQCLTLRDVAKTARISLSYLSEVERGQKECSSEILASICHALNITPSHLLLLVSDALSLTETPPRSTTGPVHIVPETPQAPPQQPTPAPG